MSPQHLFGWRKAARAGLLTLPADEVPMFVPIVRCDDGVAAAVGVTVSGVITIEIRYGLNHWNGLVRFLDDGRIELDTNIVERSIRPIVLNRKNALFAGHDQGAENWAAIASLVETCKLYGVDPQAYFADVLTKLVNLWPASRLDELMPWGWAAQRSADRLAA